MKSIANINRIAFIGDYYPRKCGIATFTHDLRQAVAAQFPQLECPVVAVSDLAGQYKYPPEVVFEISEQNLKDYRQAAEFLLFHNIEAVCVQHEFGIYGGTEGGHLLTFLREVNLPVVSTLHTILTEPNPNQRKILQELARLSRRLVTMSERGVRILQETYAIPEEKITMIPHGIPDLPFVDPAFYKDHFGVDGKKVLLSFGLLSPGKGLDYAIEAMPRIVAAHPDTVYIILGATHPNLVRKEGEAYRHKLLRRVHDLGMEEHVLFFNRFVELEELKEFIGACDIYLTPYLNPDQITSGTLAYTFGSGKAVVSTPYWHAEELLSGGRGVLVPFKDSGAIAEAINGLLEDDARLNAMRKNAYLEGRKMVWSHIARRYGEVFGEARLNAGTRHIFPLRKSAKNGESARDFELPDIKLNHLQLMTDSTGLFQHAIFSFPNFHEGYCVDDNARALLLTSLLEDLRSGSSPLVHQLARTYAAFVHAAFNPGNGRFRNFMGFDRHWLEEAGSEDSHGRVLWALGACVAHSHDRGLQSWASRLFEEALPPILKTRSPRTWAFALIGLHEYRSRLSGALVISKTIHELSRRLSDLYRQQSDEDWPWFEPILAYANAKLPHALIVSGRRLENQAMRDIGLKSLRWLMRQQTDEQGYFAPIGNDGFYPKNGTRAWFDQQPIEAQSSVSACLEAYLTTRDSFWLDEALRAFHWFLGSNKLGLPVYDATTGGCGDGIHIDHINKNQGAESTLAFLLSLVELKAQEHTLSAFNEPMEPEADRSPLISVQSGLQQGFRSNHREKPDASCTLECTDNLGKTTFID